MKGFIILPVLFLSFSSFCQKPNQKTSELVTIGGYISDSTLARCNNKVELFVYDGYPNNSDATDTVALIVKKNIFKVKFKVGANAFYFAIKGGSLYLNSIAKQPFLAQAGDSVFMDVKNLNEVFFTGNGADKLNYQSSAFKVISGNTKNYLKALKDKQGLGVIDYSKHYAGQSAKKLLDTLSQISVAWDEEITSILKLNTLTAINIKFVENLTMPLGGRDTLYSKAVHDEIGFLLFQQAALANNVSSVINKSNLYSLYLYRLNRYYFITEKNKYQFKHYVSGTGRSNFALVFENIKKQYSGMLRDQLIMQIFKEIKTFNSGDALDFLPEAINLAKDDKIKISLESIKKETPGSRAFAFTVEGFNRKLIHLEDFKGKIIVLDTYYNGCIPCTVLAEKMEPVIKYFKNRNDIVFLSVDALSKNREKFEEGVKLGIYGSKETIYAWVGTVTTQHPLIKFYKYSGYPNILIMNKEGNIISTDPVKPFTEETKNQFIKLIEKNL